MATQCFFCQGFKTLFSFSFNWTSKTESEKLRKSHFGQLQFQLEFCSFILGLCDVGALIMNPHLTIVTVSCPMTIKHSTTAKTTISFTVCAIARSNARFQNKKLFIFNLATSCVKAYYAVSTFDVLIWCHAVLFGKATLKSGTLVQFNISSNDAENNRNVFLLRVWSSSGTQNFCDLQFF